MNEKIKLPKVSFVIATYNEERNLPILLKSIKKQNYPKEKVEIIIADANSTDRTQEIAKKYKCKIIINEKKHPEAGKLKAYNIAKGEISFFTDADNIFPDKEWIRKMIVPFLENKKIIGAYSEVGIDKNYTSLNKYENRNSDPFTSFVYGKAAHVWEFHKFFRVIEKGSNWRIYDFSPVKNRTIVGLAQGFALKKDYKRSKRSEFDDMMPITEMLEAGQKIAHVTNTFMLHYAFKDFWDFVNKMDRKISNALVNTQQFGFMNRDRILYDRKRNFMKVLWIFYAASIIGPLFYSVRRFIETRKVYWFYDLPINMAMLYLLTKNIIRKYFFKKHVSYY